jgi:hypothetical protein
MLGRDLIHIAARMARHSCGHITLHLPEAWHHDKTAAPAPFLVPPPDDRQVQGTLGGGIRQGPDRLRLVCGGRG